MNSVGVLGGTFDPLHLGHLRAAEAVADALSLERVLFVPAASPPHKESPRVSETHHRVAMVESAIATESRFELSLLEVERGGRSYTIDTLRELRRLSPETRFCFITGTDAFVDIQTWKDWQALLESFPFAVHERPGFGMEQVERALPGGTRVVDGSEMENAESAALALSRLDGGGGVFMIRRPMLHVSSTEIREAVGKHQSIRYLVPDSVESYIRKNRLYE